jgi:hypothetical protein
MHKQAIEMENHIHKDVNKDTLKGSLLVEGSLAIRGPATAPH